MGEGEAGVGIVLKSSENILTVHGRNETGELIPLRILEIEPYQFVSTHLTDAKKVKLSWKIAPVPSDEFKPGSNDQGVPIPILSDTTKADSDASNIIRWYNRARSLDD